MCQIQQIVPCGVLSVKEVKLVTQSSVRWAHNWGYSRLCQASHKNWLVPREIDVKWNRKHEFENSCFICVWRTQYSDQSVRNSDVWTDPSPVDLAYLNAANQLVGQQCSFNVGFFISVSHVTEHSLAIWSLSRPTTSHLCSCAVLL